MNLGLFQLDIPIACFMLMVFLFLISLFWWTPNVLCYFLLFFSSFLLRIMLFISCCCPVAQLCPTLCDPMDCSMPAFPVHHFLEFAQTHVHWVVDAIQPSHLLPFSSRLQSFPAAGSFPLSWLFASGAQSIGSLASESVLPMNVQGW